MAFDKTFTINGQNSQITVVAGTEGVKSLTIRCNGKVEVFDEDDVKANPSPVAELFEQGLIAWSAPAISPS
jgi:hypothetical protein